MASPYRIIFAAYGWLPTHRSAPEIVTLYAANIPATAIRAKIRQRYEKNKYVDDLQAVDVLLAKSYMDYQETLNAWKMDSHLMRMFNDEEVSYDSLSRLLPEMTSTSLTLLSSFHLLLPPCPLSLFDCRPHRNQVNAGQTLRTKMDQS